MVLAAFVVSISAVGELPQEKDLLCDICQEIVSIVVLKTSFHKPLSQVTLFDDFLTSDPTEAQITEWVKGICHALGEVPTSENLRKHFQNSICQILNRPDLETTCNLILTAEIPAIIGRLPIIESRLLVVHYW